MNDVVRLQRSAITEHVYRDIPYVIEYGREGNALYTWMFSLASITDGVVQTKIFGTSPTRDELAEHIHKRIDQAIECWRGPDAKGPHE